MASPWMKYTHVNPNECKRTTIIKYYRILPSHQCTIITDLCIADRNPVTIAKGEVDRVHGMGPTIPHTPINVSLRYYYPYIPRQLSKWIRSCIMKWIRDRLIGQLYL